jgi:hypothetical protein
MNASLLSSAPALVSLQADSDLTFREVLDSFPDDPASLFTLALLLGFFGLIVWAGLKGSKGGDKIGPGPDDPEEPAGRSQSTDRTDSKVGR